MANSIQETRSPFTYVTVGPGTFSVFWADKSEQIINAIPPIYEVEISETDSGMKAVFTHCLWEVYQIWLGDRPVWNAIHTLLTKPLKPRDEENV